MSFSDLNAEFFARFGNRDVKPVLFFCPGRVNLIGEHTDYNSGYVMPCAIGYGTYMAVRPSEDGLIKMASLNFITGSTFDHNSLLQPVKGSWTNYPAGVMAEFISRGIGFSGLEILFSGDIPNGAGLSSSASIEMVTAFALNTLLQAGLTTLDLVKLSQHAENHFVGMNCGIMDQFAVGFGSRNSAIFLNCGTLDYEVVPFATGNYRLLIINTNKQRGLTDSKYNERRAECETAVDMLQKYRRIESLSELDTGELPEMFKYLPDETIFRRARHVVTENNRVRQAVKELKSGNLAGFGSLMNQSHDSLRDDYEVTGTELDTLVNETRKIDGVIGSRMTGAGFGGCTVTLIDSSRVNVLTETVNREYSRRTGLVPDFYMPELGDGPRLVMPD